MRKASPPPLSLSLSLHVVGGVQVKERKRSMGVTKVQFYWCWVIYYLYTTIQLNTNMLFKLKKSCESRRKKRAGAETAESIVSGQSSLSVHSLGLGQKHHISESWSFMCLKMTVRWEGGGCFGVLERTWHACTNLQQLPGCRVSLKPVLSITSVPNPLCLLAASTVSCFFLIITPFNSFETPIKRSSCYII